MVLGGCGGSRDGWGGWRGWLETGILREVVGLGAERVLLMDVNDLVDMLICG